MVDNVDVRMDWIERIGHPYLARKDMCLSEDIGTVHRTALTP